MKFGNLVHDTSVRRKLFLSAYALLLLATLLGILLVSNFLLMSGASLSDRLAEVGDVVTGGTAVLAVIAGLVALQAYAAATGLPRLEVQVWFYTSAKNSPVFRAHELRAGVFETTSPATQTVAMISLRNRSSYSARNPVVILKLSSILFDGRRDFPSGTEWTVFELPDDPTSSDEVVIQWDCGAICAIHGSSSRRLPDLRFGVISYCSSWPDPVMKIEILADGGYRRSTEVSFKFVLDDGSLVGGPLKGNVAAEWL